ncbi:MAG: hypothetical protein ABEJ08_05295 [Halobacteriaceae archaeon]
MVTTDAVESDMGLGLTVLFGLLTLLGAVAMLAAPGQGTKAWGFALAVLAATLAVVASQVYA